MHRVPLAMLSAGLLCATATACGGGSGSGGRSASGGPYGVSSAPLTAHPAAAPSVTSLSVKRVRFGAVLAVGGRQLTAYLFEADRPGASACTGACARVWPPVPAAAVPAAALDRRLLGHISRPGGALQLTYAGHPLYVFARDGDAGDAYGQGLRSFGAQWYAVSPSGHKLDNS